MTARLREVGSAALESAVADVHAGRVPSLGVLRLPELYAFQARTGLDCRELIAERLRDRLRKMGVGPLRATHARWAYLSTAPPPTQACGEGP